MTTDLSAHQQQLMMSNENAFMSNENDESAAAVSRFDSPSNKTSKARTGGTTSNNLPSPKKSFNSMATFSPRNFAQNSNVRRIVEEL